MASPTTWTEEVLAQFMRDALGPVADQLGWTDPASYQTAIDETLLVAEVADLATVTTAAASLRLRALARVQLWRAVADATVGEFKFSSDRQSFDRQQVHEHAVAALERARLDALPYDPALRVAVDHVAYVEDPYGAFPDDPSDLSTRSWP